jgi:hypothetical protein
MRQNRLNVGVENVAAPPNSSDRLRVAERTPDLHQTLDERIVRDRDVSPDGLDQVLLRDEAPGGADQIHQDVEGLGPQLDLATSSKQRVTPQIERELAEREARGLAVA